MIELEGIKELLTIIPKDYPSIEIIHISDKICGLSDQLKSLSDYCKYGYDLELTSTTLCNEFENRSDLKTRVFDFNKHRYNRHAKIYDFVFITLELEGIEDLDSFLKKLHPIIKNSGKLIFILNCNYDLYHLEERLIQHNYVAINEIETLFKSNRVLSAQKMHGWGNN